MRVVLFFVFISSVVWAGSYPVGSLWADIVSPLWADL